MKVRGGAPAGGLPSKAVCTLHHECGGEGIPAVGLDEQVFQVRGEVGTLRS